MSFEQTPSVCIALPAYERFFSLLKGLKLGLPLLMHAVQSSISHIEPYIVLARKNPIYAVYGTPIVHG